MPSKTLTNVVTAMGICALSAYVRRSPLEIARWRAAMLALRLTRRYGPELGIASIRTRTGLRMDLNLADWIDQHIYALGEYESDVVAVASSLLSEGSTVIDVGANIGFFTLLFAQLVGGSGKVIAFEPQPEIFRRLAVNVGLNPTLPIRIRSEAVSDVEGEAEFYCAKTSHSGLASFRQRHDAPPSISVDRTSLDDACMNEARVDLIKIDVEGAEQQVIDGMQRLIARHRPDLIVEISDAFLHDMGSSARDLAEALRAHGYRMYRISWDGLHAMPLQVNAPGQFNALFTKRERLPSNLIKF